MAPWSARASVNGLVGIKPTVGLISRSGVIPISHSQDTLGPMTRTVRDAALLLSVLAGLDPADQATAAAEGKLQADYTKFLDAGGLKGARLGVARKFFNATPPMDRFLSGCVDALKRAGAEIVDPADLPSHGKWDGQEGEVLRFEFKEGLNAYLAKLPADRPRSLEDLIEFNEKNRDREMPYFEQELFVESEAKGPLSDPKYIKAREDSVRLSRTAGIDAVIGKYKLDAIVTLTNGTAWLIDLANGDYDTGGCSSPAAVAGYPHVTVPAGLYRGLPVGLSFFGPAWSEPTLLRLAYAYEQTHQGASEAAIPYRELRSLVLNRFAVKLLSVAAQHHRRQLQRTVARDAILAHHRRRARWREPRGPRLRRNPARFLPAHFIAVRISVGSEHHLLRDPLQPLAQRPGQSRRRQQQRLRRIIQIGIRLFQ